MGRAGTVHLVANAAIGGRVERGAADEEKGAAKLDVAKIFAESAEADAARNVVNVASPHLRCRM